MVVLHLPGLTYYGCVKTLVVLKPSSTEVGYCWVSLIAFTFTGETAASQIGNYGWSYIRHNQINKAKHHF